MPTRRILLIRTSALGDIVHCLPAFVALRSRFPNASFAWVVERNFAPLLSGYAGLDHIIQADFRKWSGSLGSLGTVRELRQFRRTLRAFDAEIAIDLMGNYKAAAIAKFSGAQQRIGLRKSQRREPSSSLWINDPVDHVTAPHAVDRAMAIAAHLEPSIGADIAATVDFSPSELLPDPPPVTAQLIADSRRPMVLVQVGAGWANKTYPPKLWAEAAKIISERSDTAIWAAVAPGEEHLSAALVDASDGCVRAVDAGPLTALAALLRHADVVLGGDTGPVHLANALGTPVVCVIGPTDPTRNGPYRTSRQTVWNELDCSCCYKRFDEPRPCLLSISPQQIARRALDLLSSPPPQKSGQSGV